ncbi:MAG: zf-HC2 domain-containing protein [Thermoflexales bacterium]|nr:zf-HC2 domain-containing protein [Thermoflexales bacterium]
MTMLPCDPADPLCCTECAQAVTDYLEGVIDDAGRARFDAHLAACEPCRNFVAQMRTTRDVTRCLCEGDCVDDTTREALVHLFRSWKESA